MLYNNLKKFNKICSNGELDKAMEHILDRRIKKLSEAAVVSGGIAAIVTGAIVGSVLLVILLSIIPLIREMVFFFYHARTRISDYLNMQADLLQMNAYNVQNASNKTEEEKEHIIAKQLKIVERFRKAANKIAITGKKAEVDATKEIANSSKKMKLQDVSDELPDSVSALF